MQVQLSEAIALIGREDFPHQWPDLLKMLTDNFASNDAQVISACLQTAESLFRFYRFFNLLIYRFFPKIQLKINNAKEQDLELFASVRR